MTQDFYSLPIIEFKEDLILTRLPSIPIPIVCPTLLFVREETSVFLFGGYLYSNNHSKKMSNLVYQYKINEKKWVSRKKMPFTLVSSTAVTCQSKIYLFGGVSEDVDLTGPEFCFLEYNIKEDSWSLKVNFAIRSPFPNSKLLHPCVIPISDKIFLFFHESQEKSILQIIELQMGGIELKFEKEKKNQKEEHLFYKNTVKEKELQNNLGTAFKDGVFYSLQEKNNMVFMWNINDYENTKTTEKKYEVLSKNQLQFLEFQKKMFEKD